MKSLSKPYWKKFVIASISLALINLLYFSEIINFHITGINLAFLILINILIGMTLISEYIY